MNKQEFLKLWAEKADITNKDADKYFEALVESLEEGMKKEGKVQFVGFGNFELKIKAERKGVKNPLTGGTYDIPAKKDPSFKFASKFKDKFN